MHSELKKSGLASMYSMSRVVDARDRRAEYLGKVVRYVSFNPAKGTVTRDFDFLIKEVQVDYKGEAKLRGYAIDRITKEIVYDFGRVISMDDVRIVE
jgi:hypothetical protein